MTLRPAPRRGIPTPREHGAWVMLYAPLLTGLVVYKVHLPMAVLLIAIATAAFFAQNALGLLLRERGDRQTWCWLGGGSVLVLVGVGLLMFGGHARVLWLALPAVALLGWQATRRRGTRRQTDHSLLNEMLTVPVLGLGAPAAQIIASEALTYHALLPWLCFNLYFLGSVPLVKMLIGAAGARSPAPLRWRRGGTNLIYHVVVLLCLAAGVVLWGERYPLVPGLIGFLPVTLRTVALWWKLAAGPPHLHTIGFVETGVSLWFSVWTGILISRWPLAEAM